MNALVKLLLIELLIYHVFAETLTLSENDYFKPNTVMIAVLVRNKEHTLPYFLTCLERLEYPKDRISLWFRSDNNIDNSTLVLERWLEDKGSLYHSFKAELEENSHGLDGEESIAHWTIERYSHVIRLREQALNQAKTLWADYLWMLDSDVFLTEPHTLTRLISKRLDVSAPLLHSDGLYSNFWGGMTPNYYYLRTDDYLDVLRGGGEGQGGCHQVPMIHSAVLIDLRKRSTESLSYSPENIKGYEGPHDDIIAFALSAKYSNVPLHVCNDEIYGYVMIPLEKEDSLEYDLEQLRNLKMEILGDSVTLEASELLSDFVKVPPSWDLPVDKVFVINLERRPDRKEYMKKAMKELQIEFSFHVAVDGRNLQTDELEKLGIKGLPGYLDPYHKRPMTLGEIGCFWSHFKIWDLVTQGKISTTLVLEDDVKFEPFFKQKLKKILSEAENLPFQWDLIYLGRKKMHEDEEIKVSPSLVEAGYSYWTIGYLLSLSGAEKLTQSKPFNNLLPVDEFIPLLSDKHPRDDWKEYYPKRDLAILSASPLIIYPMKYVNEEGYVSDTENSPMITTPKSTRVKQEL